MQFTTQKKGRTVQERRAIGEKLTTTYEQHVVPIVDEDFDEWESNNVFGTLLDRIAIVVERNKNRGV